MAIEVHRLSPLYTQNELLVRKKDLGDGVCDTLKYFWQTSEHNEIGCLFLMSVDKVEKENNECRDLNYHLKYCIKDLKYSMCAIKENLICSCRAESA